MFQIPDNVPDDLCEYMSSVFWSDIFEGGDLSRNGQVKALSQRGWKEIELVIGRELGPDTEAAARMLELSVVVDVVESDNAEWSVYFKRDSV